MFWKKNISSFYCIHFALFPRLRFKDAPACCRHENDKGGLVNVNLHTSRIKGFYGTVLIHNCKKSNKNAKVFVGEEMELNKIIKTSKRNIRRGFADTLSLIARLDLFINFALFTWHNDLRRIYPELYWICFRLR